VIAFTCPTCSKRYSVPDHHAGRRTKCRQCKGPLVVPSAADPPWVKPALVSASDGTAERAKTPTDADLVLPAGAVETTAPATAHEGVRTRAAGLGRHVFVIELEFAGEPGPLAEEQSEVYREAREFLADMVYAYRRRLATNGARLKKVRVDGLEREV